MSKSKVFTGVIWAATQRFGTMIISFVTNIVLARLLTPDDFGTIGMLLLFLAIANTFVDSGFGSALIQKKDANQTDFSTVFFINLGLSLVVYAILFLGAPWVARFYDVDLLRPLLRAQGIVLILNAFCIIQTAILRKKLDFKKLSVCNLIGNLVGSILGVLAALKGFGVWSLVVRTLAVGLVTSLLLWIIGKWKPLLVFSKQSFKELFGFGGFMLLSSILTTITNNVQTLIIGKLFQKSTLGHYTQARQLRNIASDSISSIIGQVLYPDFSNNQSDNKALESRQNFSIHAISFLTIALMAICILAAKPLISLLYGEKWLECVPYFQLLCIGGCFVSLQDVNYNVVAAKGKSKMLFYCNLIKAIYFCFLLIAGAKFWGIYGLLLAMIVYSISAYLAFAAIACYYLKCNITGQLSKLVQTFMLAIIPFGIAFFINHQFLADVSNILAIIVILLAFIVPYLGLSYATKNAVLLYLINMTHIKKNA